MLQSTDQSVTSAQESAPNQPSILPTPDLARATVAAQSLESDDQVRLISLLWASLPTKKKAAVLRFELEHLRQPSEETSPPVRLPPANPAWPALQKFLFDQTNTSELFSAPRRFDLATIFVVTAAFSILFGAMSAMDFGPITEGIVGVLIAVVAAAQAYYQNVANPRGVSVVTGSISLTVMLVVLKIAQPHLIPGPFFAVVLISGLSGGAVAGYLAGVLVGGVFLVADLVRRKFINRGEEASSAERADDHESSERDQSPWTS
ncbi:MAG TPA: hypothetical protein VHE81_04740 [Lacipirellulaceae bacterium]|nr:hypothetical protein [Lacipirellulaceae bacterium]